jgi:hypothetical protein
MEPNKPFVSILAVHGRNWPRCLKRAARNSIEFASTSRQALIAINKTGGKYE